MVLHRSISQAKQWRSIYGLARTLRDETKIASPRAPLEVTGLVLAAETSECESARRVLLEFNEETLKVFQAAEAAKRRKLCLKQLKLVRSTLIWCRCGSPTLAAVGGHPVAP